VAAKKRRLIPYWLRPGEQHCAGCEGTHAHAVDARCVACDRSNCPMCIVVVEGEIFCSECSDEGRPEQWQRARSGKA